MQRHVKMISWIIGVVLATLVSYVVFFFAVPYLMAPDSLNRVEAQQILTSELAAYRTKTYHQLTKLVRTSTSREVRGTSGAVYTLEVSFYWDGDPGQNIRVIAAISDQGKSAYVPMTDDFILAPSGQFIGE